MQPMVAQFISQTERQWSRSVGASGVTIAAEPQIVAVHRGICLHSLFLLSFFCRGLDMR